MRDTDKSRYFAQPRPIIVLSFNKQTASRRNAHEQTIIRRQLFGLSAN